MDNNREERLIARDTGQDDNGIDFIVDTCKNNDALKPFETAISHPLYNTANWIVVEEYSDEDLARVGHKKWLALIEKGPEELVDISTAKIAAFRKQAVFSREEID